MPATSYAVRKEQPVPFSREPFGDGRFKVARRDEYEFAVVGPNVPVGRYPCFGKYLTVCITEGLAEAAMIAAALNAHPAAQQWP